MERIVMATKEPTLAEIQAEIKLLQEEAAARLAGLVRRG